MVSFLWSVHHHDLMIVVEKPWIRKDETIDLGTQATDVIKGLLLLPAFTSRNDIIMTSVYPELLGARFLPEQERHDILGHPTTGSDCMRWCVC